MCRIARLFLLRRLKGSMPGDARNFNNIETRAIIKFFFPARQGTEGIHAILIEILGEHSPSYATVKNWVYPLSKKMGIKFAKIKIPTLEGGGADKPSTQPTSTSRCRSTESTVSLERGVCSCAELLVFSCYRG